jgi:hypothetical protein
MRVCIWLTRAQCLHSFNENNTKDLFQLSVFKYNFFFWVFVGCITINNVLDRFLYYVEREIAIADFNKPLDNIDQYPRYCTFVCICFNDFF